MNPLHQFGISFLLSCFTFLAILIHKELKTVKYDNKWVIKITITYSLCYLIITTTLLSWINKEFTIIPFIMGAYWWIRVGLGIWRNPEMFLQEELPPELEARLNSRLDLIQKSKLPTGD